jgi:hypothetical protein
MVELAKNIWADGPALDPYEPYKPWIRAWGTFIEGQLDAAPSVLRYDSPTDGVTNVQPTWAATLAANEAGVVPYGEYLLSSSLTIPAGKLLAMREGAELTLSGAGNIVLSENSGFITQKGGLDKDTWVWARSRAGVHATGGDVSDLGYAGAAFSFDVRADSMDVGVDFSRGVDGRLVFGGSATKGGRIAGNFQLYHQVGATNAANLNRNYVGLVGAAHAQATDGGSAGTLAGGLGVYFGGASHVYSDVVGGHFKGIVGHEINTSTRPGSTQGYIHVLTLASINNVRGTNADAALAISALSPEGIYSNPHVGYKHGILFTNMNGGEPFASDATLMGWYWTSGGARTIFSGIDLSGFVMTDSIIKGAHTLLSDEALYLGANGTSNVGLISMAQAAQTNAGLAVRMKGDGDFTVVGGADKIRLRVAGVAAAINNLVVSSALTTLPAMIAAEGSDTNIGIVHRAKGTGDIFLQGGGAKNRLRVAGAVAAVNYLAISSNVTGGRPSVAAEGDDTDIGLLFATKGNGMFRFNSGIAVVTESITSNRTFQMDVNGTTYKFLLAV